MNYLAALINLMPANDPRPQTISEYIEPNGEFNMNRYAALVLYQQEQSRRRLTSLVAATYKANNSHLEVEAHHLGVEDVSDDDDEPAPKKKQNIRDVCARRTKEGKRRILQPKESSWYLLYVNNLVLEEEQYYQEKFRTRFRLPYQNYLELVSECKEDKHFSRWYGTDAAKKKASPIELLVLGSLHYLGRGWTFDDVEASTAVSKSVHRVFFHAFINFGSTVLYDRHVSAPLTFAKAKRHMVKFAEAGFDGACTSTDCSKLLSQRI